MKEKQQQTMYKFQEEIIKEYWILMNSKNDFLRNRSGAEYSELVTSYERLEKVWDRNRTEALNSILTQKYHELREIQSQLNKDWENWKNNIEQKHEEEIKALKTEFEKLKTNSKKTLELKKGSLSEILKQQNKDWEIWKNQIEEMHLAEIEEKKLNLKMKTQIWRDDILIKIEKLNMVCKTTSVPKLLEYELNEILKEKKKWSTNLKEMQDILSKKIQSDLEMNSNILKTKLEELKKNREILKKQFNQKLTPKLNQLKEVSEALENTKAELKTKYGNSLKMKSNLRIQKSNALQEKKVNLRKQLETNFLKNSNNPPQNYPEELKSLWMQKDWGALSAKLNAKKSAINQHENYLTRELGRKGKTLEWFMETYKNEID